MKLFVWDFHGVLEKGNEFSARETTNRVLEEYKKKARLSPEGGKKFYGIKWVDYFRNLCPGSSEEELKEMTLRAFQITRTERPYLKHIKPMDHAKEVLQKIISNGNINILISNTSQKGIIKFTDSVGLTNFFHQIIGVDNHLEKQNITKTQALKDFLEGKEYDKFVMIGDHPKDIEAGKDIMAVTYYFRSDGRIYPDADYNISDLREVLKEV